MSKSVKIVETGERFRSAADCAAVLRVTTAAVVHCLKGRRKTVAGCTVVYDGYGLILYKERKPQVRRIIYDDAGRWYEGYSHLARVKGITPARARTLVLRDGVYKERRPHNDLFGPLG